MSTLDLKDDFGAIGDGIADDTLPIKNFFAALQSTGKRGISPSGKFKYLDTAPVPINSHIKFEGNGHGGTQSSTAGTRFICPGPFLRVLTPDAVVLSDFRVTSTAGAGAASIDIDAPAGQMNADSHVARVLCENAEVAFRTGSANHPYFIDCIAWSCTSIGFYIRNQNFPDDGDGEMRGCISAGSAVHILLESGGGLRIIGGKLAGGQAAIRLRPKYGASATSQLNIESVNIDSPQIAVEIMQDPTEPADRFSTITINGCLLGGLATGVYVHNNISNPAAPWINELGVTGCRIYCGAGNGGVVLGDGVDGCIIDGNTFYGPSGSYSVINGAHSVFTLGSNHKRGGII